MERLEDFVRSYVLVDGSRNCVIAKNINITNVFTNG